MIHAQSPSVIVEVISSHLSGTEAARAHRLSRQHIYRLLRPTATVVSMRSTPAPAASKATQAVHPRGRQIFSVARGNSSVLPGRVI